MKPDARAFEGAACEPRLQSWIYRLGHRPVDCKFINSDDGYILFGHLMLAWAAKRPIIALGNNASRRIGKHYDHFKLPHPSGRNRQINDKEFIAKKLAECKEWLNSVKPA